MNLLTNSADPDQTAPMISQIWLNTVFLVFLIPTRISGLP